MTKERTPTLLPSSSQLLDERERVLWPKLLENSGLRSSMEIAE